MTINKLGFTLSFLVFLSLATISTGFDIYAHSLIYYFFDYPNTSTYLLFNQTVMPRYLLLSYILEITRRIGIPTGVVVFFLILYPAYNIGCHISERSNKVSFNVSQTIIMSSVVLLSFFYSGLSLVLIWLMALLITHKKIFMIGVLFHPIGLILGGILVLFFRSYLITYIIILCTFYIALYLLTIQGYFMSSILVNVKYELPPNKEEALKLFERSFESKINEFYAMFTILFFAYLSKTRLKSAVSYIRKLRFSRIVVLSCFFMTIIAANIYFISISRHNLIKDTISLNLSDPVYFTWYDWGERDLNEGKQSLRNKRYE